MLKKYEAVGTGIEEMATAQNYETNSKKDVLGRWVTKSTKGNKVITVTPIAINKESEFAKWVDTAIERDYQLSQLEKDFLFVKMYKKIGASKDDAKPLAYIQKGVIVPTDWAIGNQELQAGVEVNLIGKPTFGVIDFDAPGEKFTEEDKEPTSDMIFYEDGDASREDFVMYYIYEGV